MIRLLIFQWLHRDLFWCSFSCFVLEAAFCAKRHRDETPKKVEEDFDEDWWDMQW